jgi:hypothetical protein
MIFHSWRNMQNFRRLVAGSGERGTIRPHDEPRSFSRSAAFRWMVRLLSLRVQQRETSDENDVDLLAGRRISGGGIDDIAPFTIQGIFDSVANQASWTKTYIGSHAWNIRDSMISARSAGVGTSARLPAASGSGRMALQSRKSWRSNLNSPWRNRFFAQRNDCRWLFPRHEAIETLIRVDGVLGLPYESTA